MRHFVSLASRPHPSQSIEAKHRAFLDGVASLPSPWGLWDKAPPTALRTDAYGADVSLTKYLRGAGVTRAWIGYDPRYACDDDETFDDIMRLHLDTEKADFRQFAYEIFPKYVLAFDAYCTWHDVDDDTDSHREETLPIGYNARSQILWVDPLQFWDGELLRRGLAMTAEEVATKLRDQAEHVQLLGSGVYVIGSSEPLDGAGMREYRRRIKPFLLKPPAERRRGIMSFFSKR